MVLVALKQLPTERLNKLASIVVLIVVITLILITSAIEQKELHITALVTL